LQNHPAAIVWKEVPRKKQREPTSDLALGISVAMIIFLAESKGMISVQATVSVSSFVE
jgi:hypothetical protein